MNLLDLKPFDERIPAKDPDRQTAKIQIRIALMHRASALGTAEIVHGAHSEGKGAVMPQA